MSVFPDWQKYAVHQRNPNGCIPTGYELLLRAAGENRIDFDTFQEDFDLDLGRNDLDWKNNFGSVAAAVKSRYPFVQLDHKCFKAGSEKLRFIEEMLSRQQPVLVSLSRGIGNGWHIMPLVDATEDSLTLLKELRADGTPDLERWLKAEFVRIHDTCPGGHDVAFLQSFS